MAQRRHHYESAFEHYLRARRIPYVAVDEARKALLPDDAASEADAPAGPNRALKSFDFVLYGRETNLLIEIKGRRVVRRSNRLENWVTEDDVASLTAWERLFGPGFTAAFVFIYWCDDLPASALFEEIFEFRDRWYALRAAPVTAYAAAMRPRSARWRTVHVPPLEFERISTTLCGPGTLAAPRTDSLQHATGPVA